MRLTCIWKPPLTTLGSYWHVLHTQALHNLQKKAGDLAIDQRERLGSFVASLEQIKAIVKEFQKLPNEVPSLPRVADIQGICDSMAGLRLSLRDMSREQDVLRSLSYEHELDRYRSIAPAHPKTFSWVFDPANLSREGPLVEWFRHGQGVFWITGKPGSGKSTLMKFLCDNPQTITVLKEWACDKKLVIASHYFWLPGTMMQKSQEGRFRSLLYGIFRQRPELIQQVFPERWEAASDQVAGINSGQKLWTMNELLTAISSLTKISHLGSKFCIFIDGLDEYQGDHIEMCKTIQKLGTTSDDIKLCVSSRPWNDFEEAFGGGPHRIQMHQLTKDDIRRYTHARLSEHWAWERSSINTSLTTSLINLILDHAKGVFLWVVLVTKEMRESMSNYDSLEDLHQRVAGFPTDLGEFFKHILESVDPFYHAKMSTALQISLAAPGPLAL
jgi:hypothetical protein